MKVGDIVWYNHGVHETVMVSDQPLPAIITYVHARRDGAHSTVNLAVFGKNGDQWQKHSVHLWDGEADMPERRLAFAYPAGTDLDQVEEGLNHSDPEVRRAWNWGKPVGPATEDEMKPSKPFKPPFAGKDEPPIVEGKKPTYAATPVPPSSEKFIPLPPKPGIPHPPVYDMSEPGLVSPSVGPEYKPDAPRPTPMAPEPINKVPADSPANPDRPLD